MQKYKICKILFISLTIFIITFSLSSKSHEKTVLLYAPISLSEVIKELINSYKYLQKNIKIKPVFMGTSKLVMQVKNGARPDLFISANLEWMDYLERKKIISKKFRKDYLSNSLVVITNKENSVNAFKNIKELENAFLKSKTKISLAMTNSIPAGIYAKEFLENIGVWKNIKRNYVESPNVRTALNYVARNELEFGIVYKTEVVDNSKVKIVHYIDDKKHKKIIYPIAALNEKRETMEVYNFFLDNKNLTVALKWGFEILK